MRDVADIYYGWFVVAGCFIGSFVVFGVSYSFGVFLGPLQQEFDISRSAVSLVFSIQTAAIYIAAALFGIVADRRGVQRMMVIGTALFVIGISLTVITESYPVLLFAYGIVTAVGLGAIYVVSYATIPRWFKRRRGFAAGLGTSGLGVGMVILPPAASVVIGATGWQLALLIIAAVATAVLIVAAGLISDSPASQGVNPTSEFADGYPRTKSTDWNQYRSELTDLLSSRPFLLLFWGWVLIYATMYIVFVHLVAHADATGIGEQTGALALAIIGLTTAVARIVVGSASDRFGRIRTFISCSTLMAVSTLALPFFESATGLFLFAVLFGIAYGGNGALLSPVTADLFGTVNPNAIFGLVSLSFAVSGAFFPWAAGAAYDVVGTYSPSFVGAGLIGLLGAGLVAAASAATT